jgi:hypothetical protein
MLPLMILSMHQSWLNATAAVSWKIELGGITWDLSVAPTWIAFLILVAGAAWWSNRWLSHQMEHEADLEAIQSHHALETKNSGLDVVSGSPQDHIILNELREALWRLAAYAGDDWKRATWFHPSISSRLEFLNLVETEPSTAMQFQTRFSRTRWSLLLGWMTAAAVGLFVA